MKNKRSRNKIFNYKANLHLHAAFCYLFQSSNMPSSEVDCLTEHYYWGLNSLRLLVSLFLITNYCYTCVCFHLTFVVKVLAFYKKGIYCRLFLLIEELVWYIVCFANITRSKDNLNFYRVLSFRGTSVSKLHTVISTIIFDGKWTLDTNRW